MDDLGWKFGDVIENRTASADNPTRRGYFVRVATQTGRVNPGRFVELTDGKGSFWRMPLAGQTLVKVFSTTLGLLEEPQFKRISPQQEMRLWDARARDTDGLGSSEMEE